MIKDKGMTMTMTMATTTATTTNLHPGRRRRPSPHQVSHGAPRPFHSDWYQKWYK